MLRYVLKLTRDPGGMTADDVGALRAAGFDERAVLDICQVASYYNYVNRLADGLGVELEEHWHDDDCTLTRDEFVAMTEARRSGAAMPGRVLHRPRAGCGEMREIRRSTAAMPGDPAP